MAYTLQTWVDGATGNTPLNATRLNYIEAGIGAAYGQVGLAAAIPAASATNKGTWFWASDTGAFSFSDGTAWHSIAAGVTSFNTRTGAVTLTSADVTTALGYTPPSTAATSVFGRSGAVVAVSGDYTAAQVTNAADKASASTQTFTGALATTEVAVSGLTGAVNPTRYVGSTGATTGGAPTTGTFAVGDFIIDPKNGAVWICTVAGTPGTWANAAAGGTAGVSSFNARTGAVVPASGDYTAAQVTNAADKSTATQQTFTANVSTPALIAAGLTGAVAASRYVGALATGGTPASGTFAKGDFIIGQDGTVWICTVAGTPGTWAQVGGGTATAWTSYTPTLTGTGWAVGNGTLVGYYRKIDAKTVALRIHFVLGTTTTIGSGGCAFSLPATMTGAAAGGSQQSLVGTMQTTVGDFPCSAYITSGGSTATPQAPTTGTSSQLALVTSSTTGLTSSSSCYIAVQNTIEIS